MKNSIEFFLNIHLGWSLRHSLPLDNTLACQAFKYRLQGCKDGSLKLKLGCSLNCLHLSMKICPLCPCSLFIGCSRTMASSFNDLVSSQVFELSQTQVGLKNLQYPLLYITTFVTILDHKFTALFGNVYNNFAVYYCNLTVHCCYLVVTCYLATLTQ